YDFEVFKQDWLVVIINPIEKTEKVIVNDPDAFRDYYESHKAQIWIGYNNRHYDQWIAKAILAGCRAWDMNDWLINQGRKGWEFSSLLNNYPMINYDLMLLGKSLKQLEGFQGHNIHEIGVDFRINRKLTQEEIEETVRYCRNDVEESINIWLETRSDFEAQLGLVRMFQLPLAYMGKTKAQMSAEVLECVKTERKDEWDLFTLPCLRLSRWRDLLVKRKKRKDQADYDDDDRILGLKRIRPDQWFLQEENHDYRLYFECSIAGVLHQFGWGGLHGAPKKYHHKCGKSEIMLHIDVSGYYPRLMIFWDLLSRNARNRERYKWIYDYRVDLKHQGKKKEQAPLKIVLNAAYGITKDPLSKAYDPRNANLVCVNGQLLLLDLLEKLGEGVPSFEIVNSNTDGLIIKIDLADFGRVDDICWEWEQRTRMILDFDYIDEIWQKDVNNYIFRFADDPVNGKKAGTYERKGAYVKELSAIDNDLPIINKAMVEYIIHGIPVEKTVRKEKDLVMFQKICKLTTNYMYVEEEGGRRHTNKCFRIFASLRPEDGKIYKVKTEKGRIRRDKFGNTSEHSFIENGPVKGKEVPWYLDRNWYINLTKKRLEQFGVMR
ncbi:MAG: hypothetical protein IIZ34_05770, partial [Eubacterium sp.]|nr:hypothetical protein [Eubacterium sp.]